jgi:opacity protein-like surface antigen
MYFRWITTALFSFCTCAAWAAETPAPAWYAGMGIVFPQARETRGDFQPSKGNLTVNKSTVTFPDLLIGRRFEHVAIEAGYRKLGVIKFTTSDLATEGNNHANAGFISASMPFGNARSLNVYGKAGLNIVRSITTFSRRAADYPIAGGRNHWTLAPSLGLGVAVSPTAGWTVRAEYEWLTRDVGDAQITGRSRQSFGGLQIVRSF